jgi:alkylation response protein AidB-like acyl-CoA dehydrogenase
VYLALTDEQEFLREAATGSLSRHDTLAGGRAALDGAPRPELWELAREAGWPGLLSSESVDGADLGAYEAMLVLEACGARLADAGLLGHLPAVALLELADADPAARTRLATGECRAAFVDANDGCEIRDVLDAADADVLVIARATGVHVVQADDPAVDITRGRAYDATRSLATVTLNPAELGGRVAELGGRVDVPRARMRDARDLQQALLAAESVGAAQACMEMARDYAVDRHAFGRAIGSYQAIKHKLVEMMRRIENGRSLLVDAGRAWALNRDEFAVAACAARVVATDALDYAAPENIFIHGGIGATWEHDAQLYYRRAEVSRRLAGGAEAAAEAVAVELLGRGAASSNQ